METHLPRLSYVRIDDVQRVPLKVLVPLAREDGLALMLQEKSFKVLDGKTKERGR